MIPDPYDNWDWPDARVSLEGGPSRIYDDDAADPNYVPPPFLGFRA